MITVRVTCRICGTVDLEPEQVTAQVLEYGYPAAGFTHCDVAQYKPVTTSQMMRLRVLAGCELIDWRVPMQWLEEARS